MESAVTQAGTRWINVGQSDATDPGAAGRQAAEQAGSNSDAKLVIVFCSNNYDLDQLLAGIRGVVGTDTSLIGCTTAGEIATNGPGDTGVVVTILGGSGFQIVTKAAHNVSTRLREAGAEVAGAMIPPGDNDDADSYRALLLLTDGLAGDQQEIVRGAYGVLGATVPLVGGCAGDDLKMESTFQLFDGEVLQDSVVAAAIISDAPIGIGVKHGWTATGDPMLVTKSEGNHVFELDDRPALDLYLDQLNAPDAARTDAEAFTKFAQTHPLGMTGRGEEAQVRFIGSADFERRSIESIAAVPEGSSVWVMRGDDSSVLDATDAACHDALIALDGRRPTGMLAFDCIGRKGILGGDGTQTEVDHIAERCGGAPVAGFYTYGEIARTRGISGFHNQTLVVLALG